MPDFDAVSESIWFIDSIVVGRIYGELKETKRDLFQALYVPFSFIPRLTPVIVFLHDLSHYPSDLSPSSS